MKIHTTHLTLRPPDPFHFAATAYSHGWVVLLPNQWDGEKHILQRIERLPGDKVVRLTVREAGAAARPEIRIAVEHPGTLSAGEQKTLIEMVGHMFRVDEAFHDFYELCRRKGGRWEKLGQGLGRLLRSPGLFEDIVKTLCTTNIQWGGTKRMVEGLVAAYGESFAGDPAQKAFPTAEAIAAVPLEDFTAAVRLGYRAEYVHTLARRIVAGELDLSSFWDRSIPTSEMKKRLLAIKGVGNYAAATLLMLLGRYDELAVDSVFRQFVAKKYFPDAQPTDAEAQQVYADWGEWKYLAYWFDVWEGFNEQL
ncbi:MAG: hypothetical protein KDH97_16740 [Calditrichaeota bacterium]|nr:hypothetical protein [Calditrichota bacterium]